jgi:ABC-2 type transport system ATP-binding protein
MRSTRPNTSDLRTIGARMDAACEADTIALFSARAGSFSSARLSPTTIAPQAGDRRIRAVGITRSFGATKALQPIDLDLGPGGIIGLLGPNGSGKSTLLRVLTGVVPRDAGEAWVDGVALEGDGTAVRKRATYAPGELALYREMRGDEHLAWLLRGRDGGALARAKKTADELGLPLRARVRTYSHGMKRQLLFAAALAPDVGVRILDEPTDGLDPSKRGVVLDLLLGEARKGTTILLSSHHFGEVDRACDRLVFLSGGKVIADETAAAVTQRARRSLRMEFETSEGSQSVKTGIESVPGARSVRVEAGGVGSGGVERVRVYVELDSDDPRAFLARVCASMQLPRPTAIEYGQLSLVELYRVLYGVEAC